MDNIIIRGTTPTISYQFTVVNAEELTKAILTFKKDAVIVVEKDLDSATVTDHEHGNTVSWKLSQDETLLLYSSGILGMMLNWKTPDGTRGASEEIKVRMKDNHIAEVI